MSAPNQPFARIPYTLYDTLEKGDMTLPMFIAMTYLHKWADWSNGIVRKMSADRLVWATNGEYSKRTFQLVLHRLHKAGYIRSDCVQGKHGFYAVTLCNYLALSGALKDSIINSSKIGTWRDSEEGPCEVPCEAKGEVEGEVEGEVFAPSSDSTRDSTQDFNQPSNQPPRPDGGTAGGNSSEDAGSGNSLTEQALLDGILKTHRNLRNEITDRNDRYETIPVTPNITGSRALLDDLHRRGIVHTEQISIICDAYRSWFADKYVGSFDAVRYAAREADQPGQDRKVFVPKPIECPLVVFRKEIALYLEDALEQQT